MIKATTRAHSEALSATALRPREKPNQKRLIPQYRGGNSRQRVHATAPRFRHHRRPPAALSARRNKNDNKKPPSTSPKYAASLRRSLPFCCRCPWCLLAYAHVDASRHHGRQEAGQEEPRQQEGLHQHSPPVEVVRHLDTADAHEGVTGG